MSFYQSFGALALSGLVAFAQAQTINLGPAATFGGFGGQAMTNTGPTNIYGDIGVYPGTSITGFGPPGYHSGAAYSGDNNAKAAFNNATAAFNTAIALPCTQDLTGLDLGGMVLTPGVYCFSTSAQLTGNLILNGGNDPNALFVFQVGTSLITAAASSVTTTSSAQGCAVYWAVGTSATFGATNSFAGHVLAAISISVGAKTSNQGGLFALSGALTLDSCTLYALGSCGGKVASSSSSSTPATTSATSSSPRSTPTMTTSTSTTSLRPTITTAGSPTTCSVVAGKTTCASHCAQDDCYRMLVHYETTVANFCTSFMSFPTTPSLPATISQTISSCGPSRVSSACRCIHTFA